MNIYRKGAMAQRSAKNVGLLSDLCGALHFRALAVKDDRGKAIR
jgi:hypothetical protein